MTEKTLKVKAAMKSKQPRFVRQESYKARVNNKWRKPRGLHSKMKKGMRGAKMPLRGGWQTPKDVRGMTKDGLLPVRVQRVQELEQLKKDQHTVVVARVGAKRKIEIIEEATKKGLQLHNATKEEAVGLKDRFAKRHADKAKRKEARDISKKKLEERLEKEEKAAERKEATAVKKIEKPSEVTEKKTPEAAKSSTPAEKQKSKVAKKTKKTKPKKKPEVKK